MRAIRGALQRRRRARGAQRAAGTAREGANAPAYDMRQIGIIWQELRVMRERADMRRCFRARCATPQRSAGGDGVVAVRYVKNARYATRCLLARQRRTRYARFYVTRRHAHRRRRHAAAARLRAYTAPARRYAACCVIQRAAEMARARYAAHLAKARDGYEQFAQARGTTREPVSSAAAEKLLQRGYGVTRLMRALPRHSAAARVPSRRRHVTPPARSCRDPFTPYT